MDIARDSRKPRINNGADAGNRHRSLGYVRREYHAALLGEAERPLLLGCWKRREKGNRFVVAVELASLEIVRRLAYVALPREEHEHVVIRRERSYRGGDFAWEICFFAVWRFAVLYLYREETPGDGKRRCAAEELREALCVQGRGRDYYLEVAPLFQNALENPEKEVDVERTLVRLVDDDRVVGAKKRVGASLREKDAVRHELDARQVGDFSPEAVLVADDAADGRLQFLRNALCNRDGGEAARLRASYATAVLPAAEFHCHLRELRCLA